MARKRDEYERIRKKGDYYVLEELKDSKVIRSWTLNPKKLLEMFKCPTENNLNMSKKEGENVKYDNQNFAQDFLNEHEKDIEKLTQFSDEQIKKLEEVNRGIILEDDEED